MRTCDVCLDFDPDCKECGGSGQSLRYRCPQSEAGDVGAIVVRAAAQWQNGILPGPGGSFNQCSKLERLVGIAWGEKARIEQAEAKVRDKGKGGKR